MIMKGLGIVTYIFSYRTDTVEFMLLVSVLSMYTICRLLYYVCCTVLQVNLSPSFHTDSSLDKDIKDNLLFDALNLMNWSMASKHKCLEEQKKLLEERLLQRQKAKVSA